MLTFYNCRVGAQLNIVHNVTLDSKHWEYIGFRQVNILPLLSIQNYLYTK